MDERYRAWWEEIGNGEFLKAVSKHPGAVMRQIEVACDMAQAPGGSDQETFPTLSPDEAQRLIKADELSRKERSNKHG
jgi:hypothetical protein